MDVVKFKTTKPVIIKCSRYLTNKHKATFLCTPDRIDRYIIFHRVRHHPFERTSPFIARRVPNLIGQKIRSKCFHFHGCRTEGPSGSEIQLHLDDRSADCVFRIRHPAYPTALNSPHPLILLMQCT